MSACRSDRSSPGIRSRTFAGASREELASRYPERYVATASKSKRRGKVFIDYLRNARGATFVAPYSTRAREHAPIAVPLAWDELDENFRPDRFTLRTLRERLAQGGPDPFERLTSLAPSLASDLAR